MTICSDYSKREFSVAALAPCYACGGPPEKTVTVTEHDSYASDFKSTEVSTHYSGVRCCRRCKYRRQIVDIVLACVAIVVVIVVPVYRLWDEAAPGFFLKKTAGLVAVLLLFFCGVNFAFWERLYRSNLKLWRLLYTSAEDPMTSPPGSAAAMGEMLSFFDRLRRALWMSLGEPPTVGNTVASLLLWVAMTCMLPIALREDLRWPLWIGVPCSLCATVLLVLAQLRLLVWIPTGPRLIARGVETICSSDSGTLAGVVQTLRETVSKDAGADRANLVLFYLAQRKLVPWETVSQHTEALALKTPGPGRRGYRSSRFQG